MTQEMTRAVGRTSNSPKRFLAWYAGTLLVFILTVTAQMANTAAASTISSTTTETTSSLSNFDHPFYADDTWSSSSSSSRSSECVSTTSSCLDDAVCSNCLTNSTRGGDSGSPCQERYPVFQDPSASTCEKVGATYCCYYGDVLTAQTCLANQLIADYWDCVLSDLGFGCFLEDMPCYGEDDAGGGAGEDTPSPSGGSLWSDNLTTPSPTGIHSDGVTFPSSGTSSSGQLGNNYHITAFPTAIDSSLSGTSMGGGASSMGDSSAGFDTMSPTPSLANDRSFGGMTRSPVAGSSSTDGDGDWRGNGSSNSSTSVPGAGANRAGGVAAVLSWRLTGACALGVLVATGWQSVVIKAL